MNVSSVLSTVFYYYSSVHHDVASLQLNGPTVVASWWLGGITEVLIPKIITIPLSSSGVDFSLTLPSIHLQLKRSL